MVHSKMAIQSHYLMMEPYITLQDNFSSNEYEPQIPSSRFLMRILGLSENLPIFAFYKEKVIHRSDDYRI